jgi:hypothetical protein
MNMESLISIFSTVSLSFGVILIAMIYYKSTKERRYDDKRNRAELEKLRFSYEEKIYDLMDRLISTESRWKDANHLVLSAQVNSKGINENNEFLTSNGIDIKNQEIDKELVFVLTPYHTKYEETFKAVSETCQSVGMKAMRGDEKHITGDILSHTLHLMTKARFVVANIDGRNPNVFYELGLAHALNKNVIIVSSSLKGIPVDVKSNRMIIYSDISELKNELKNSLARAFVHSA